MTERRPHGITATRKIWIYHQPVSVRERLLALLLRPTARPWGWGVVVAIFFITLEVLLVLLLKKVAPENAFGAVFLLGVIVVSAGWNFGLAVATSLVSALVYVYFHLEGSDTLAPAAFVFLPLALLTNLLVGQARLRAAEAEQRRREASALAQQQTALRRVATMVARGAPPEKIYPVAVSELSRGVGVDHVTLLRYEPDDTCVVLAALDSERPEYRTGQRFSLDGDSVSARVRESGDPARVDNYDDVDGTIPQHLRSLGLRSGVGAPLIVDDSVRGVLVVGTSSDAPLPPETAAHVGDFADLVATAISNAENRAELTASRARIVAAADQARRRFERDLHDGAQQRIVSLGLQVRGVEALLPPEQTEVRTQLAHVVDGLSGLYTDLQELSRGIHPAILSKGGLGPAMKTLARRSSVPVELDLNVDRRLPESVEVAAYYVVAEALTNAAKHAQASIVTVGACADDDELRVVVVDDGVGGATSGGGSGLIGLKDRVEALSGRIDVVSPPGGGTTLTVRIPLQT